MRRIIFLLFQVVFLLIFSYTPIVFADSTIGVPILVYHNFDPSKRGSMTISTAKFESQLQWLKVNGYTIIPLMKLVDYLQGKLAVLPQKSIVITVDDGRESIYKYMLPIVRKYQIPVTLFIYPEIISHASYALTWEQLKELQKTGLFTIGGHTYWHPNFKQEKRHLSKDAYQRLVHIQLFNSKKIIEKKLGSPVTLLAWPFGIHDNYLENEAKKAGYIMAFSIHWGNASRTKPVMAEPRYMVVENQSMKTFEAIVEGRMQGKK